MADALDILRRLRTAEKDLNDTEFESFLARNGRRHKEHDRLRRLALDKRQIVNEIREEADAFLETANTESVSTWLGAE